MVVLDKAASLQDTRRKQFVFAPIDYLQDAASAADLQNPMSGFVDGFRLKMGVLVHR